MATATGACVATIVSWLFHRMYNLDVVLNGALSGLVSITASAPWVRTYSAFSLAVIGYFVYHVCNWGVIKLGIDDPATAFALHGGCGMWGLLAAGLFQDPTLTQLPRSYGQQLWHQVCGSLIVGTWSFVTSLLCWLAMKYIVGVVIIENADDEFRRDKVDVTLYPQVGPHGTVTLLFTDIQSSTTIWEADEETMAEALTMHDETLRECLKAVDGFEVKTEGDAFMAAFASGVAAVKFCVMAQHHLLKVKWPRELYTNLAACIQDDMKGRIIWKGLRVRMGIHTGQPSCKENPVTCRTDYFGRDVNYASRVSSLGSGGQILLSSASMESIMPHYSGRVRLTQDPPFGMATGHLYEFAALECWVQYMGTCELKGISEGEHVYQAVPFGLETRQLSLLQHFDPTNLQDTFSHLSRGSLSQKPVIGSPALLPIPSPRIREANLLLDADDHELTVFVEDLDHPTRPHGFTKVK
jgi:class 3 adenylate cyclase